jgi:hypothetical protein
MNLLLDQSLPFLEIFKVFYFPIKFWEFEITMNHGFRVRKKEDQNYIVAYFAYINLKRKKEDIVFNYPYLNHYIMFL